MAQDDGGGDDRELGGTSEGLYPVEIAPVGPGASSGDGLYPTGIDSVEPGSGSAEGLYPSGIDTAAQ